MAIPVRLSWDEVEQAAFLGVQRFTRSRRASREPGAGLRLSAVNAWALDIESAAAEMAVAKAMNRFWCASVDTFKREDVQGGIQVRYAKGPESHLIVRPDDPDDHKFVLVTGPVPEFVIRGWIWGHEAKQPEWLDRPNQEDRPACYMVPQSALHAVRREAGGNGV